MDAEVIVLLAAQNVLEEVSDHPLIQQVWFGMKVTVWSSGIAAMLVVAALAVAIVLPLSRRAQKVPSGARNVLEVLVVFVRDMIARPALHDKAYAFLPYLLTMFVFVLGMNLLGMAPLKPLTKLLGVPVGGTPTSTLSVCGAMAAITLGTIVVLALRCQTIKFRRKHGWPLAICAALSPVLWIASFAPHVPGLAGVILIVPLTLLEFVGVASKCFALMIRLFANMVAGHVMLAVLAMLGLEGVANILRQQAVTGAIVGLACLVGSVAVAVMELLVAGIQAYVFTLLSAIFLGLYVDPAH